MAAGEARKVTVIGAGIVGTAIAAYLQMDGHEVTLIDRDEPGRATSFGNSGGISPGSVAPVSMPGMVRQIPRWLLDPTGPLFLSWAYLPAVLPWLIRFIRAGDRDRVRAISRALSTLNGPSFDAYEPLLRAAQVSHLFHRTGQLFLYRQKTGLTKDMFTQELREAAGNRVDILDAGEVRQLEPVLAPIFEAGVFMPDNGHCKDPFGLVQALAETFVRGGGTLVRGEVRGFETGPGGPRALLTDAGAVPVETVVIAAGAWSHRLTKQLGHRVPLESHRGYHVTLTDPGVMPRIMCFPVDHKFAITPMEMGLRFGGTVELAGLDAPPNYARAQVLLRTGAKLIPGLKTAEYTQWMGHRPCLPDSLPVLGRSPRHPNLYFAFGHGHQGLLGRLSDRQGDGRADRRPAAVDGPYAVPGRSVLRASAAAAFSSARATWASRRAM